MRRFVLALVVLWVAVGCGSDGGGGADVGASDVVQDAGGGLDAMADAMDAMIEDASGSDSVDTVLPEDVPAAEDTPVPEDVLPDVAAPDDVAGDDAAGDDVTPDAVDVVDVVDVPQGLPRALPFEFTRPADGEPIPEADTTAFTKRVTGLWKDVGWFRWLLRTSTGVDASTGTDDYLAWYNDVRAIKEGDTVTFQQRGGDHNMWIPGSKVLSEVVNGYLLTGDWTMGKAAEQYCKGLTAVVKGFVWDEDDPAPFLMARAVFPMDQDFTLDEETWRDDGRRKIVEFSTQYRVEDGWNAHTFEWPHNPTWGYMWVTNMRSKDDVCAIVRSTTFLPYIVEDAPDEWVREACRETWETMQGFNKDIVDSGYYIRTKDPDGTARIETEQDLGNYVQYMPIDETNECPARLASDLIAYGEPLTNDCGSGWGSVFERIAVVGHYYNYPIVWDYHMAALGMALVTRHDDIAYRLLDGMRERMDAYMDPETTETGAEHHAWRRDMAVLLVKAASLGLPLTAREARHIQAHWEQAIVDFADWPYWDLWADSVPDGEYRLRPSASDDGVPVEALTMFLEYCNSPFKNPAGASFVDCDVVRDTTQWGE